MTAVVNTSPLVVLTKVRRLALLRALYDDLAVPRAVVDEMLANWSRRSYSGLSTAAVFERRRAARCSERSHSTSVPVKLRRSRSPQR
jgi:predicted nucleic acid-binding protein